MTLMERLIFGALLCLLVLAAAVTYDPLDRYQYDQGGDPVVWHERYDPRGGAR